MQFLEKVKPPVGIMFDSDMGNRIDAALALALLYGFDGKNEARVVSVSVSKPNLRAAAFCDAVGRFYAGPVNGGFGGFMRSLPVGLADSGPAPGDTSMLTGPLERRQPDGTPVYATGIRKPNDTAEVRALLRNAFTSQYDQNCIVVLAGPANNLVQVLDLPGARELIARKVKFLALAGGAYPQGPPESHIRVDIAAASRLFAEWPTPIVAAGREVGEQVLYPAQSIEKDFAWSPAHPVADAYRAYRPMPYDAPTWDMAAVLYAVRPQEGYFQLSPPGTILVRDDGSTQFTPTPGGRHRYLIPDPAQHERILKIYTEVSSARPAPRKPRFRQKQDEQKEPAKPAEAKPQP